MARYPGAIWKPITAGKGRKKLTVWNRVNLHIAVSNANSLHGYFNKSGIPDSHFYVRHDGKIEQYVDTAYQAFADLEGNDATISIETAGTGTGNWSAEQRESLAQLYAWAVKTHGIARKMATSSKPGNESKGLSWHRLGCDGNFPPLPSILAGRTQRGGGMRYSLSLGKVCPTDARIKQIPGIYARALVILDGTSAPAKTAPEEDTMSSTDSTNINQIETVVRRHEADDATRRVLDLKNMKQSAVRQSQTITKIDRLETKVDELTRLVTALTAALTKGD